MTFFDPLEPQLMLGDRSILSEKLQAIQQLMGRNRYYSQRSKTTEILYRNPLTAEVFEGQDPAEIISKSGLHFPIICKPIIACGAGESHVMTVWSLLMLY